MSSRTVATLQALLVTFLWSTSWVLIKIGLDDIPPLTFAGLRYTLAFLCLVPFVFRKGNLTAVRTLDRRSWLGLIVLGILMYATTQGGQFMALLYLPAITVNLIYSFTAILVALLGIVLLKENLTAGQWGGVGLYVLGAALFFFQFSIPEGGWVGVIAAAIGLISIAAGTILGRSINRTNTVPALVVTVISMGVGSVLLLITGIVTQGLPPLSVQSVAIIAWLAVVNSAFAFTLWNHTMRVLPAAESMLLGNAMMIQIPILSVIFLGETMTLRQIFGLALAAGGIVIVSLLRQSVRVPSTRQGASHATPVDVS